MKRITRILVFGVTCWGLFLAAPNELLSLVGGGVPYDPTVLPGLESDVFLTFFPCASHFGGCQQTVFGSFQS